MPLPPERARAFEAAGKQGCDCVAWSHKRRTGFISRQGVYESPRPSSSAPGLDRSPPPRWMGGQGGQSLKVFGRTRSFWGLSSPKIEMGGKALKWLSRLDYPLAKTGETVNGGAESAVHLDR